MPFQSYAQIAWLKHNRPDIYEKWKKKYGEEPEEKVLHVKKKTLTRKKKQ